MLSSQYIYVFRFGHPFMRLVVKNHAGRIGKRGRRCAQRRGEAGSQFEGGVFAKVADGNPNTPKHFRREGGG